MKITIDVPKEKPEEISNYYCETAFDTINSERHRRHRSLVSLLLSARSESLRLECEENKPKEHGRIILMSSAIYSTDILSSEFFSLYDQLEYDASSLETSTESLKEAKIKLE